MDEFKVDNERVFKKYLKTVQKLEIKPKKQVPITNFFTYEN